MNAIAQLEKRNVAPLPAQVDAYADEFSQLDADVTEKTNELKILKADLALKAEALIALVSEHGGSHAQKSKILHGIVWEIVATFAQYTTQDAAAVERFRQALVAAGLTRLMKKIFTSDVRWTMKSSAAEIVKAEKLSPRLMALLLQCQVTQDKKPALDVRPKKKPAA